MGKQWKQEQTLGEISWAPKSLQMVTIEMKLKDACSLEEKLSQTHTAYKKAETVLFNKVLCQQISIWSKLWFFQ